MRSSTLAIGTMALIASAGLCVPAMGQAQRDMQDQKDSTKHVSHKAGAYEFVESEEFIGTEVINAQEEEIGTVVDLLVDRGSGRATHVLVDTSNMLGLGGKTVAVPYNEFGWDRAEGEPRLNRTKDQLETLREFSEDTWRGVANPGENDLVRDIDRDIDRNDPYRDKIRGAERVSISGTIVSVDRVGTDGWQDTHRDMNRDNDMNRDRDRRDSTGYNENDRNRTNDDNRTTRDRTNAPRAGENVIIAIQTDQGTKRVLLGPSWYVLTGDSTPTRGDRVQVQAYRVGDVDLVASSATLNGKTMTLRSNDGAPSWHSQSGDMEMRSEQTRQRYALLSELDDKNVICRGEACGEIEQTIIECREGRVAFIVIDPDENFLGIADTSRLVPFEVLGVTTGDEVRLDATKDMVLSSREMPDDLQTLDKTACESIYNAFGIKHPKSRNTPMSWRSE